MWKAFSEVFPGEERSSAVWPRSPLSVELRVFVVATDRVTGYEGARVLPVIAAPLTLEQLIELAA